MSAAQEAIIRCFLRERGLRPKGLPYDWMDLDGPYLDECPGFYPIPDDVLQAYEATRNNPEDRERDADSYAEQFAETERQLGIYPWEWEGERRKKNTRPIVN
jgi:hypothetical protein